MALTKTFIPLKVKTWKLENWKKNKLYLNVVFQGQIKKKNLEALIIFSFLYGHNYSEG